MLPFASRLCARVEPRRRVDAGWPAAARAVLSRYACQCDVLFDLEYAKATARETCRELLFLILSSDSHLSTVFELGALCGVRGWCGVRRWGEVA